MYKLLPIIVLFVAGVSGSGNPCVPRSFGTDRIVCVCNATYCDTTPQIDPPEKGTFYMYTSTKAGLRLDLTKGKFNDEQYSDTVLTVNSDQVYQTIFGFGCAFTDSAGLNIKKLSPKTQEQLIRAYYTLEEGSGYTLGRVPIGATDFSTRPYTYDDVNNDMTLQQFALAFEDHEYKIPFMKFATQLTPDLKFTAAAWTAPPWMKTNNDYTGFGFLKKEHYGTYAKYLLKFVDEYWKQGLKIWTISTGNEPSNAFAPTFKIPTMGWLPWSLREWIANDLGPTFEKSNHNDTGILILDDQRFELPWFVDIVFKNALAKKYVAGTAVHSYWDNLFTATRLDEVQKKYPDKFILMTESCTGNNVWDYPKVILGSWSRGERHIKNIFQNLNHWAVGWIDWNSALDKTGGPNWVDNYVDATIIVNPETDEFFKQPMYYAIKHFSRFILPGSRRISMTNAPDIDSIAFLTPQKEIVIVLYNWSKYSRNITINDLQRGKISLELPTKSLHTLVYQQ